MTFTPPTIARAQTSWPEQLEEGTVLSFTTVAHPPAAFGSRPRTIGLIALKNGKHVLASILTDHPDTLSIGMTVRPRMRFSHATTQKLRVYQVAYEPCAMKPASVPVFPGYILALTGPSGVGKTTVSALLSTRLGSYASRVPITTTRESREGDDASEYRHTTTREFLASLKKGEIVAATRIPSLTEERWYGYRSLDIQAIWKTGKVPVVVTERKLLQGLARHFGRRSILSLGLLPPGHSKRTMLSHLLHRLRQRGRDSEESIAERMRNAEHDLRFFEEQTDLFDHLLVNEDLDTVLASITQHVMKLSEG
ncbi:MAG: OB-fold domain-containing protein [Candidatus Peregrinibacteria bacterium]